jgi:hypothetical protein
MMKNHLAENIITRGNMNTSALSKGYILPGFTFRIRRKGGSSVEGSGYGQLQKELEKQLHKADIDAIEVFVEWNKVVTHNKKIYAEFIEKKITATLLNDTGKNYNISVEIVKD